MSKVSEPISVISVINVSSVFDIVRIEALFHGSIAVHREGWFIMGEMSILEELDSISWHFILRGRKRLWLEFVFLLWSSSKATISCLEVRTCDIRCSQVIKSSVKLSSLLSNIKVLSLHWSCWVKASCWTFKLHSCVRVLEFVLYSFLSRTALASCCDILSVLESTLVICLSRSLVSAHDIVCSQVCPRSFTLILSSRNSLTNCDTRFSKHWLLATESKMLLSKIIDHGTDLRQISLTLRRNCARFESSTWCSFKSFLSNEVCLSIKWGSLSPLSLAHHLSLHLIEVTLISSSVEGRWLA